MHNNWNPKNARCRSSVHPQQKRTYDTYWTVGLECTLGSNFGGYMNSDFGVRIVGLPKGFAKFTHFECAIAGYTTFRLPINATIKAHSLLHILLNNAALIGKQPSRISQERYQGRVLGAVTIFFNCITIFCAVIPASLRHKGSGMSFLHEKKTIWFTARVSSVCIPFISLLHT